MLFAKPIQMDTVNLETELTWKVDSVNLETELTGKGQSTWKDPIDMERYKDLV